MSKGFSKIIIKWYQLHKRSLPWRETNDAYCIWLSEIILQQTQVKQGLPYYNRFLKKYPTVKKLAAADEDSVLKLWQGLGYYSRARNLLATAKNVAENYEGVFPDTFSGLLQLKGIGRYTAAAIASIAYNLSHAVVDGNVYRLLSRYFGIKTPTDSSAGKKKFETLANKLIDKKNPALFNQAMMELGAMVCKPLNPFCNKCPLAGGCHALMKNKIDSFPVKNKKQKTTDRWFYYFVFHNNNNVLLRKRIQNDIWKNLYDFPFIETGKKTDLLKLMQSDDFNKIIGNRRYLIEQMHQATPHKLSHRVLHATFLKLQVKSLPVIENGITVNIYELEKIPVPKLIENYLIKEFGIDRPTKQQP